MRRFELARPAMLLNVLRSPISPVQPEISMLTKESFEIASTAFPPSLSTEDIIRRLQMIRNSQSVIISTVWTRLASPQGLECFAALLIRFWHEITTSLTLLLLSSVPIGRDASLNVIR